MLTPPYEEDKQTDVKWEERWTFDKCKCVEAWMGNDDFFFCHWEAEEEQNIHNALELNGLDQFCVTECYRIHSDIDTNALTGKQDLIHHGRTKQHSFSELLNGVRLFEKHCCQSSFAIDSISATLRTPE